MLESEVMEQVLYGEAYARVQSRKIPPTLCRMLDKHLMIQSSDRVLEVGVGSGALHPYFYNRTPHVVGIDINEWLLRTSRKPYTVIGDATKLPFSDASFNHTVSVHALEHILDLQAVFQELDRVTVNDGHSFHIFPAFLISKAEGAILETVRMYTFNPLRAWREAHRLHMHNLNPQRISDLVQGTNLHLTFSKKIFVPETKGTNWVVVLQK